MAKNIGVRKTSKFTLVVYGIIIMIVIFIFWVLGAAMDFSVTPDGTVDINLLGNGFEKVMNNPQVIFSSLKNKNSYAPKMLFLGACSTGIYVLYKYTEDKKRLHRRGVEHGSAKWGDDKEMKSLAEIKEKPHIEIVNNT